MSLVVSWASIHAGLLLCGLAVHVIYLAFNYLATACVLGLSLPMKKVRAQLTQGLVAPPAHSDSSDS